MKHLFHCKACIGFVTVCGLMLTIAVSLIWVPTVHAELPPRLPVATPESGESDDSSSTPQPATGQIHLYVWPVQARYWSVVQWQDSSGKWQDVDGWEGDLIDGHIMWTVEEKDFGTGPFRWAVYQNEGPVVDPGRDAFIYLGDKVLLATSEPFNLPDDSRSETIHVSLDGAQDGVASAPVQEQPGGAYGNQWPVNPGQLAYGPNQYQQPYRPNQRQQPYHPNQYQHPNAPNQQQQPYHPNQYQQPYAPNQQQRMNHPRYQPYQPNRFNR